MAKKSSAPVDDQQELAAELEETAKGDETPIESSQEDGAAAGQADSADSSAESVAAPAPPSVKEQLAAKGIEVEGDDDETILNNLSKRFQQARAVEPYVGKVHEYIQNAEEMARWKVAQQQQAYYQQQQAQQAKEPWWNPPTLDKGWLKYVDRATGSFKEGTPLHIQEGVQKYLDYQQGFTERFLENPADALKPWAEELKQEWLREAQHQYQQQQYQQQVYQEMAQIGQQNAWMYQTDAEGGPVINPATGQRVMTDVGMQVIQSADALLRQAPQMPWPTAVRTAIAQVKANVYEPYIASLQHGETAGQTNGKKKNALLTSQANKTPSRRGSLNGDDDGPPQNSERVSFSDLMRAEIRKSGKDFSRIEITN